MSDFADRAEQSARSVPGRRSRPAGQGAPERDRADRVLELLRRTQDIRETSDLDAIMQTICVVARDLLGWRRVVINLLEETAAGLRVRPAAAVGLTDHESEDLRTI